MAVDYAKKRKQAEVKLKKFGTPGVLRRKAKGEGSGDPWDPVKDVITDYPISALIQEFSEHMINGTTILYGDRLLMAGAESLVTAGNIVPTAATDKVILTLSEGREIEYAIVNVKPMSPGGVDILYELQVRGPGR